MAPDPLIEALAGVVGRDRVLSGPAELSVYASDGNALFRSLPRVVVLPASRAQVQGVMRILHPLAVPVVARGAGTGLSGGALPVPGSVVVGMNRMNRILAIDHANRRALVEPGVINAHLSAATRPWGLEFAPDPSSQAACTVGGNVAENSGGAHCLKYGVTTHHVLALELVQADGQVLWLGAPQRESPGLDLRGLVVGSEGTMGIVTGMWLRLIPVPASVETVLAWFNRVEDASDAVSDVIASGVLPAALEMMDRLAIAAVERGAYPVGFPSDLGAVLLLEVDGGREQCQDDTRDILAIVERHRPRAVIRAENPAQRTLWWHNRKTAFGSMGRIAPAYYVQDGVIPRSALCDVLARVQAIGERSGLAIANVFHAGDGNLHPLILFDPKTPGSIERVMAAGTQVLAACVEAGGAISGEHGIGVEKREEMRLMFSQADLALMARVRRAMDPTGRMNPGKLLPTPGQCIDRVATGAPG